MKATVSIAIFISSLCLLYSCSDDVTTGTSKAVKNKADITAVKVAKVYLHKIPKTVAVPGSVVPDQKAKISSRLMGYIKTIKVKTGQNVKAGDLLFTIDSSDIKSKIKQAQSAYKQAWVSLNDAKMDYKRFEKLYKEGSVSRQRYDKNTLKYSIAQQSLASAKSSLEQAKSQLNYANVTAPFAGVVVKKMAVAGDLASPGKAILVLENLSSLSIQTQVSNRLYANLHLGDKALIKVDGTESNFVGVIYALVSSMNPKTRTHTVKLSLNKMQNINSGTFARVVFNEGFRQAILVPQTAIVNRSGIIGVFVVDNNRVHLRMVRTGMAIGSMVEIQAGLSLAELIVINNNQSLLNDDEVKIIIKKQGQ